MGWDGDGGPPIGVWAEWVVGEALGGKALGWLAEGPRFESASALLSLQTLWSMDTVLRLCPSQLRNIKMALIAAHLNPEVIPVVTV